MRTVRLYGDLGKKYGAVHRFHINSPAEAIRALIANFPSIQKHFIDSEKDNIGYVVKNGRSEINIDQIQDPASGDIRIIPTVAGSSAGARVIIGAVLIAAAVTMTAFGVPGGQFVGSIGVSLVLGGVIELLSPPPKLGEPPEGVDSRPSYFFNGPVNTTAQGQPVSVGYGRLMVGGAIISAGIVVEQIMSGYRIVRYTRTVDINATMTETNYSATPPTNYFRKEQISYDAVGFYNWPDGLYYPLWVFRYYYYEDVQELVPV